MPDCGMVLGGGGYCACSMGGVEYEAPQENLIFGGALKYFTTLKIIEDF